MRGELIEDLMANGYSKLTGKKRDIRGYRQLYLASDHLLLVDSTRFAQEYRKFALADIQAIVTTARPPAVTMRVVMAILMAGRNVRNRADQCRLWRVRF